MELVQIIDSVKNELLKVIVPNGVAEKCRRDVEFATDLYKQINQSIEKKNNQSLAFQNSDKLYTGYVPNENSFINSTVGEKLDSDGWFRRDLFKFIKILQKFRSQLKNPSTRDNTWPLISKELAFFGISKSIDECKEKWRILLQTHKFIGDKSNPRWQYFKEFSSVLNGHYNASDSHYTKEDDKTSSFIKLIEPKELKFPPERDFWSKLETLKFLSTYQKHKCDRKNSNEKQFWSIISSKLAKVNVIKSWEKCCIKWKNLYRTYKKNLTRNVTTARRFMFFEEMDEVLNNVPVTDIEEDLSIEALGEESENEEIKIEQKTGKKDNEPWSSSEMSTLIETYSEHRNYFSEDSHELIEWELISSSLSLKNVHRTPDDCEREWKALFELYTLNKHKPDQKNFEFYNKIDTIFSNEVKVSFKADDKKRHKENCGCFERKMIEKGRRHQERMGMMKRKLDLEERKLLAFEKYLNYLKTEKE